MDELLLLHKNAQGFSYELLSQVQQAQEQLARAFTTLSSNVERLEGGLADISARMFSYTGSMKTEKAKLVEDINEEFSAHKNALQHVVQEAQTEFLKTTAAVTNLQNINEQTYIAYTELKSGIDRLKQDTPTTSTSGHSGGTKGYLPLKNIVRACFLSKHDQISVCLHKWF